MIKFFMEGRGGGWGGGSSERCLKWGGGGSLRDLSKNSLKQGMRKGKSCFLGGRGILKVSPPLPPSQNFNRTYTGEHCIDDFQSIR